MEMPKSFLDSEAGWGGLVWLTEKLCPVLRGHDSDIPKASHQVIEGSTNLLKLIARCRHRVAFDVSNILKNRHDASGFLGRQQLP